MGWNSWDCYGAGVWEADVLANADYMNKYLKSHGWNFITIDIQWYEPLAHTTEYRRGAVLEMDVNGRPLPAPNRQVFAINNNTHFAWVADVAGSKDKYVAIFNASPAQVGGQGRGRSGPGSSSVAEPAPAPVDPAATQPASISVSLADIGLTGRCKVRDLWAHKDLGAVDTTVSATVNSHGAVFYRVSPVQ